MADRFDERLLVQEVKELTELLRTEDVLDDLRALLLEKGLDPNDLLLTGFIENERGLEMGVVITRANEVYEFERNVAEHRFMRWQRVKDPSQLLYRYPAILIGLGMSMS